MPIEINLVGFDGLDQKEERLGLKCPSLLEVQIAKPVQMALAKGLRMANSASDYTIVRFSSCTLAEEGREQALEELHERGLLPTRFMRYSNAASRVDLVNRTMPGLRILTA